MKLDAGRLRALLKAWLVYPGGGARFNVRSDGHRMDEFDHRLRRAVILFYVLGSCSNLLVANSPAWRGYVNRPGAHLLVVVGLVSALVIRLLPWQRYGRDLFVAITLYSALLLAALTYVTGWPR